MITLVINNSICQAQGLTIEQYKSLKEELSYSITNETRYFSGAYKNYKRYLIDKSGKFPTGLIGRFIRWTHKNIIPCEYLDQRVKPKTKNLFETTFSFTPYPEQVEAAEACARRDRGIISAPTGAGKSVIAALIISKIQVRTLVVVPTLELKRQLTESLSSILSQKIGKNCDVWVENVDALSTDSNEDYKSYNCVIIDEFHHSAAKTYRKLNQRAWTDIYYRFGLTATPFRSNEDENILLESVIADVIYRIPYKKAIERKFIIPMEVYYYELPKQPVEGYTWAQVYSELVVKNEFRNLLISWLIKNLHFNKKAALCLVKEIAHGESLSNLTGGAFANGQDESCQHYIKAFNDEKLTALIGTTGVLGEGVDTKPAEYVIIAGLGKSKNALMQMFGRGFRVFKDKQSCKIILFKDPSHKFTLNHFRAQRRILKEEYGVTPVKLQLPPIDIITSV